MTAHPGSLARGEAYYNDQNFTPDMSLGYLIRRIHLLTQTALEPVFDDFRITSMQWSVLAQIFLGRGDGAAAIAREIGYDNGSMTRLLDDLEAKALIVRERASPDRRRVNLILTEQGRLVVCACKKEVMQAWNMWLSGFDAHRLDALMNDLSHLKATLEQESTQ